MIDLTKEIITEHGYKVIRISLNKNPNIAFPLNGYVQISDKVKREMNWTKEGKQFLEKPSIWDLKNK